MTSLRLGTLEGGTVGVATTLPPSRGGSQCRANTGQEAVETLSSTSPPLGDGSDPVPHPGNGALRSVARCHGAAYPPVHMAGSAGTLASSACWRTREKVTDMAYWQQRGTKRYLTQSRKHQGRVIREYLGTGPSAEALYHVEVLERQQRHAARAAWRQTLADQTALDAQVQRWWEQQRLLLQALLYSKGFYRHDRSIW